MAVPETRPGSLQRLRFAVFEADLVSGELTRRGARVHLPDKPFQVLAELLERPGEVISRGQLQQRLWAADTFVDFDNNLNAAVRRLREALGDSAESPRFVETLPKRGYRFIAPVEPIEPVETAGGAARRQGPPRSAQVLAVLVVVAVLGLAMLRVARGGREGPPPVEHSRRLMLAVMPFATLDERQDRQFFGDGLTEELITQLGRLQPERLGVIARMSSMHYRGSGKSVETIGAELGVGFLLEGSVRSEDERARITVQLVQVADQTQIWAEIYDVSLDDLLQVQGDVAIAVAQALALELLPEQPLARARAGTRDTGAYEAYLRGRFEWNTFTPEGYDRAIEAFEAALELDPGYAAAWAGLANTYNLKAFTAKSSPSASFPEARRAALAALELDPNLAPAHYALAFVQLYHDYDAAASDRQFRRAVELAPNDAMAYHWWAGALAVLERHDEAIEVIHRAVELDPVSLSVLSDMGWYYLFADRHEEGVRECRRILETEDYGWAEGCVFEGLVSTGRLHEALQLTAYADPEVAAELAGLAPGEVLRELQRRRLEEQMAGDMLKERYPLEIALTHAALGDADSAFEWLEKAYELRQPWLVFLKVDPRLDALAGDPRYTELADRLGLP